MVDQESFDCAHLSSTPSLSSLKTARMTVNLVSFCREVLLLYFLDYGQLHGRNSEIFELLMYITHDWTQLRGSYKSFIIQIV
jgi:hypothetical protein